MCGEHSSGTQEEEHGTVAQGRAPTDATIDTEIILDESDSLLKQLLFDFFFCWANMAQWRGMGHAEEILN